MKLTGASRWFKLNEETDRWKRLVRMAAFPPILSRRWNVFGWHESYVTLLFNLKPSDGIIENKQESQNTQEPII